MKLDGFGRGQILKWFCHRVRGGKSRYVPNRVFSVDGRFQLVAPGDMFRRVQVTDTARTSSAIRPRYLLVLFFWFFTLRMLGEGPQTTPSILAPASTPAHEIYDLSLFVLSITGGIFLVVGGLLAFAIIRYRARKSDPHSEPAGGGNQTPIRAERNRSGAG